MMYKVVMGSLMVAGCLQIGAADRKFAFIDANFEDFAQRIIAQEQERNQFKVYYANLAQKINEAKSSDQKREKATYRYLYKIALENLKVKHNDWYHEIAPFVSDPQLTLDDQFDDVRHIIKFFLTRYGAYEEFLHVKAEKMQNTMADAAKHAQEVAGLWGTVTSFVSSVTSKIAGIFGFGGANQVSA